VRVLIQYIPSSLEPCGAPLLQHRISHAPPRNNGIEQKQSKRKQSSFSNNQSHSASRSSQRTKHQNQPINPPPSLPLYLVPHPSLKNGPSSRRPSNLRSFLTTPSSSRLAHRHSTSYTGSAVALRTPWRLAAYCASQLSPGWVE
jgi:hypothetical protein